MAAIDALAAYMSDLGLGTVAGTIFLEHTPDAADGSMDTVMTIIDTGGGPPALTKGDNTDSPSFQIRARSPNAATCLANLLVVFNAYHGLTETTLHSVHFKLVWALQSNPVSLGRDEKQRFNFSQNYRAYVSGVAR